MGIISHASNFIIVGNDFGKAENNLFLVFQTGSTLEYHLAKYFFSIV